MSEVFSENISNFLDFCRNSSSTYKYYKEIEDKYYNATQDCLHQLEFGSYKDRNKTATLLANIRKARRFYKDNRELMEPFIDFMNTSEYLNFYKKINEVLGKIRQIEKRKNNKKYNIKALKNVEFINKTFENDIIK